MKYAGDTITPLYFYNTFVLPIYFDDDLDSYQKLLKIQYKLNEVIENQTKIIGWMNELKEWLDKELKNLVDNKLEEWMADGTLETLIANHLEIAVTLKTTKELIAGGKSIRASSVVKTLGYSALNDNGGASFFITATEPIYPSFPISGTKLYAQLIPENKMNALQFGIVGDGVTDVTEALQNAIKFVCDKGDSYLYIPDGTYMIDGVDHSKPPAGGTYLRDSGGIKLLNGLTLEHGNNTIMSIIPNNYQMYVGYRIYNSSNITIKGGSILGDRDKHIGEYKGEWGYLIAISGSKNITIDGTKVSKAWGDGINIQYLTSETTLPTYTRTPHNITIKNVISDMNRRQGLSIEAGVDIVIKNSKFTNTNGTAPQSGIDLEPSTKDSQILNVTIDGCYFENNANRNLTAYGGLSDNPIATTNIINCRFGDCMSPDKYNIVFDANVTSTYFRNCTFNNNENSFIVLLNSNGPFYFINNVFMNGVIQTQTPNTNCYMVGNFIRYSAYSFLQLTAAHIFLFQNNTVTTLKNEFISLGSRSITSLTVINNYFTGSNARYSLVNLTQPIVLTAYNNVLPQNVYVYDGTIPKNVRISQGGVASLMCSADLPQYPKKGDMVYRQEDGGLYIYAPSGWRKILTVEP